MSVEVMSEATVRHRFTVDEFTSMFAKGVFPEEARLELLDGVICDMSPIGPLHTAIVNRLNEILMDLRGKHAIVGVQNSIILSDDTEPEPDIVLLKPTPKKYKQALPGPDDILLLIEVAHTSLDYDRNIKLPRYAAANIAEVWIVDLDQQQIEQYLAPQEGKYSQKSILKLEARIAATQLSGISFGVEDVFA